MGYKEGGIGGSGCSGHIWMPLRLQVRPRGYSRKLVLNAKSPDDEGLGFRVTVERV